jgi:hypothetical protein
VRRITASIFCSTRQLIAAAAPATSAMPSVPNKTAWAGGTPGDARNMPITAVKTINDTTRGFVNARNCRKRCGASARVVIDWGAATRSEKRRNSRRKSFW